MVLFIDYLRVVIGKLLCLLHFIFTYSFQKAQPNGRAVAEPQEETMVSEEIVPHHHPPQPEVKADKVAEVICCTDDIWHGCVVSMGCP